MFSEGTSGTATSNPIVTAFVLGLIEVRVTLYVGNRLVLRAWFNERATMDGKVDRSKDATVKLETAVVISVMTDEYVTRVVVVVVVRVVVVRVVLREVVVVDVDVDVDVLVDVVGIRQ